MTDDQCETCGIGFILPSGRCDHCDSQKETGSITIRLTDAEARVLLQLSKEMDLPQDKVMIMGLRLYQMQCHPVKDDLLKAPPIDPVRCPECGYTEEDCSIHHDHRLCSNFPFFDWEQEVKE